MPMRLNRTGVSMSSILHVSVVILFVISSCFPSVVLGEQGRYYDELLWTKGHWQEYKLRFPYREFLFDSGRISPFIDAYQLSTHDGKYESTMLGGGHDDPVSLLVKGGVEVDAKDDGGVADASKKGDGPVSRVVEIRTASFGQDVGEVALMDKIMRAGTMVEELVECDVQHALNDILWPVLANWTLVHGVTLKKKDLIEVGYDACSVEVPVTILKDLMLMQVVVDKDDASKAASSFGDIIDGLPHSQYNITVGKIKEILSKRETNWKEQVAEILGMEESALEKALAKRSAAMQQVLEKTIRDQEHYLATMKRHDQHALPIEISSVKSACTQTLSNAKWSDAMLLAQQALLKIVLRTMDFSNSVMSSHEDDNDRRPIMYRKCVDYHPQCEYWAKKGECKANPNYMIGTRKTGQCRLACGVCEKEEFNSIPAYLSAKNAQLLEDTYTEIFTSVLSMNCYREHMGTELNAKSSLIKLFNEHSTSHAKLASQLQQAIGPITLKIFTPESLSRIEKLGESVVSLVTTFQRATVPLARLTTEDYPSALKPPDLLKLKDENSPQSLLWDILHDRCLYVYLGYWNYQFCYGISVVQYHVSDPATAAIDASIHLGSFVQEDGQWNPVQRESRLYDSRHVPAILQTYADGSECILGPEDGENKDGPSVPRQAFVYFMCSPDGQVHMIVNESPQCSYNIEVYLPDLCQSVDLAVTDARQKLTEKSTSVTSGAKQEEPEHVGVEIKYLNEEDGDIEAPEESNEPADEEDNKEQHDETGADSLREEL